jgi:hypothetical protein
MRIYGLSAAVKAKLSWESAPAKQWTCSGRQSAQPEKPYGNAFGISEHGGMDAWGGYISVLWGPCTARPVLYFAVKCVCRPGIAIDVVVDHKRGQAIGRPWQLSRLARRGQPCIPPTRLKHLRRRLAQEGDALASGIRGVARLHGRDSDAGPLQSDPDALAQAGVRFSNSATESAAETFSREVKLCWRIVPARVVRSARRIWRSIRGHCRRRHYCDQKLALARQRRCVFAD